jgi:hypothetical protein
MYTNIPIREIRYIINEILNNDNETFTIGKQVLEILLYTIFDHNYIQFNDQFLTKMKV